jgi:hypothetical protein
MANAPATTTTNGQVSQRATVEKFHRYMLDRAANTAEDMPARAADINAQQGERILNATTEEEIWAADQSGAVQARDVVGTEWQIRGYEPVPSNRADIENNKGYYFNCEATLLGGPGDILRKQGLTIGFEYSLQTGADLILFKLRAFEARDLFPIECVISGTTTASGRTVLRITPLPKRAVKSSAE